MPLILFCYTFLLLIVCLFASPAWIIKMKKRGGWGTGLKQRLGLYKGVDLSSYKDKDYYHAVSVGEAVMALKLVSALKKQDPEYRAIIACTTATGHEIARQNLDLECLIIYAPLDFPFLLHRLFSKITPRQIILVDSELWPNLLHYTRRKEIITKIVNGRISEKSYKSFTRWKFLTSKFLAHISVVCTDGSTQCSRWETLGVKHNNIYDVGSLKFDFETSAISPPNDFLEQLASFPSHEYKVLLASTHAPEEKALAHEIKKLPFSTLLLVAPRHAERRNEVKSDLESLGYKVTLKSRFSTSTASSSNAFLIDTTGELSRWTHFADLVIIGKSWLSKTGGQNPFESIAQTKPLIAGPHMENFEPLFSEVVKMNGAIQLESVDELSSIINELIKSGEISKVAQSGKNLLSKKLGATQKTVKFITQL